MRRLNISVLNGGKFKLDTVPNGLFSSTPTQLMFSSERMIHSCKLLRIGYAGFATWAIFEKSNKLKRNLQTVTVLDKIHISNFSGDSAETM